MADVKISALPAASTPLAGTEVLPIVQGGTTDKVSVANLTAGRTMDAAAVVVGAGNVSAPSITFTGDTNTGIYSPAADTIAFTEGGVEAMRLDASGNVGIGTNAPGTKLDIYDAAGGGVPAVRIRDNVSDLRFYPSGGGSYVATISNTPLIFNTNNTERMRIDASGNVGIGTSSPNGRLNVAGGRAFFGPNNDTYAIGAAFNQTRVNAGQTYYIGATDSATPDMVFSNVFGSEAVRFTNAGNVGIGTSSPNNRLQMHNASSAINYLQITNSSSGSGSLDGMLVGTDSAADAIVWMFENTNLKFATNNAERVRIDNSGNTYFGNNTSYTTGPVTRIYGSSVSGYARIDLNKFSTGTFSTMVFYHRNNGVGSIDVSDTATSYLTSSDYRLKANVVPLTGAAARVQTLKPSRFNFIADPDRTVDGFIAHEAAEVVPEAVTGEKDALNEDGSIKPQGIDHSKLVPLLTAALQEALTEIAALKARVAALESK